MNEEEFKMQWDMVNTKIKVLKFDGGRIYAKGYDIIETKSLEDGSEKIEYYVKIYTIVGDVVEPTALINLDKIIIIY